MLSSTSTPFSATTTVNRSLLRFGACSHLIEWLFVGSFEWGAQDFSGSAQEISFSLEGADNVPVLRAQLQDADGNWEWRDVNLAERIGNRGGCFNYGTFCLCPTSYPAQTL